MSGWIGKNCLDDYYISSPPLNPADELTAMKNIFDSHLGKQEANYQPLSPITLFRRVCSAHANHLAVIHGKIRRTWGQVGQRCDQLAHALRESGIVEGSTVAIFSSNTPEMLEAHYAVPMTGGVICAINTRLDAKTIAFILEHGEAQILLADRAFATVINQALSILNKPDLQVIEINDDSVDVTEKIYSLDYEEYLLSSSTGTLLEAQPRDEWQAIALSYTSGTTGDPKGVVTHHRGAFLAAMGNPLVWEMTRFPVYLWTLPIFHCNGWCFPWALTAVAGTSVCLRHVETQEIFRLLEQESVTHLCGAPVVMSMLANADKQLRESVTIRVKCMTAGAPPPTAVIQSIENMGFELQHVYGLTETYGPSVVCETKREWGSLDKNELAKQKARQGIPYPVSGALMVADPTTLIPVPRDGITLGEIFIQGNLVMKGYLKNPSATADAFAGNWFHSGDLGVWFEDGYIQLKDRIKDIIISGGENISSMEIEDVLLLHPSVCDAAVVACPDEHWGETPCAFVTLIDGKTMSDDDVKDWCRENMARFKCPGKVIFGPIQKTATGKVQKFKLRELLSCADTR